jgi:hypothetical protein
MDKIIQKFSIWTNVSGSGSRYNSSTFKDTSILKNYDFISNLNKNINNNAQRNMILHHPKLNMIQINNKQDWDFLIENNIINECIENIIINKEKNIRRNVLKINYANKKTENGSTKYIDIVKYIINNFSFETYITLLLNFIKSRKDILTDFNFYVINDLLKLKDLQEKNEENEANILNQEIVENKTIFETNLILQNLENKFNEIKEKKKLYEIKSDLYFEKQFEKDPYTQINNNEATQNDLYSKDKNKYSNMKSVFNIYKSSPDYYKIDSKNGNLFGMQNREEYYNGIDGFKDEMKRLLKKF